ncbi:MAG TPA: response regulator transcription factor [Vicinamibacterales bacterium]
MNVSEETSPIRVFLMDRRPLRRAALKFFLHQQSPIEVVADADDDPAIAILGRVMSIDVVLISCDEPARLASLVHAFADVLPSPRLVWLAGSLDEQTVATVVDAGLVDRGLLGMVDEHVGLDGLVQTLQQVAAGETSLGEMGTARALTRFLRKHAAVQEHEQRVRLTRRELEVISLLAKAQTNKQIAETLSISHATVRNHLTAIFRKLELSSRLELMIYAFKHDLVDPALPFEHALVPVGHARSRPGLPAAVGDPSSQA